MSKQYDLKERILLISALLCALLLLLLLRDDSIFDQLSPTESHSIGELVSIENDVRYKTKKAFQWKSLRRVRKIHWGDSIFTGKNSRARIRLEDGSIIDLQENSLMLFAPSTKDLLLDLRFGNVTGTLNRDSRVVLNAGGEVIDLTGKDAVIEIGRDSSGELLVKVNNAPYISPTKNQVIGKAFPTKKQDPVTDRKPAVSKPSWRSKEMLIESGLIVDEDANIVGSAPLDLKWDAVADKDEYELEIAEDNEFKTIANKALVKGNSHQAKLDRPGNYFARLRPRNGTEESWSSPQAFSIKLKDPPRLPAPDLRRRQITVDGVQASEAKIEWRKVDKAKEYRVEIAKSEDFKEPKVQTTKELQFQIEDFTLGRLFIRVSAMTPGGRIGLSSDVAHVDVNGPEPSIDPIPEIRILGKTPLSPPEPVEIKVKWTPNGIAKSYELQISKDAEFSAPTRFRTPTPSGALKVKDPGNYYVRVRPLDGTSRPLANFSSTETVQYIYRIPLASPTLVEPPQNITMFFQTSDAPFYFVWKKVPQAGRYVFEVSIDPEFSSKVFTETVTNTRILYRPDVKLGQLHWRVRAENSERESHWSQVRTIKLFSGRKASE